MQRNTSPIPHTPHAESDPVAAQLRDLGRQGGGMASLAHLCAGLLLAAFSLGSLISISQVAFYRFLAEWSAGRFDVPDAISLAVNLLLVLSADIGLLYAASQLRTLGSGGAPPKEKRTHRCAMAGASALESASYLYLVWTFDRPTTLFLWAIGITRALAAPLFAAYLSMARPIPVGPRDVAYQAALASGRGVVHDVAVLAADPSAPLERKVHIFRAASTMTVEDRARFDGIIEAVRLDGIGTNALALPAGPSAALPPSPSTGAQSAPAIEASHDAPPTTPALAQAPGEPPTRPPTGGGSPSAARPMHTRRAPAPAILRLEPDERRRTAAQESAKGPYRRGVRTARTGRGDTASREVEARAAWAQGAHTISRMRVSTGMSKTAAASWVRTLKAEAKVASRAAQ